MDRESTQEASSLVCRSVLLVVMAHPAILVPLITPRWVLPVFIRIILRPSGLLAQEQVAKIGTMKTTPMKLTLPMLMFNLIKSLTTS